MAPVTISGWERVVDVTQPSLFYAIAAILWNPLWWNLTARNEHRNKTITRVLGGNRKLGCYGLAAAIFSLGMVRDTLFKEALKWQPRHAALAYGEIKLVAVLLFVIGQILVITSTWKLGITGTFLGDYFGILMDHKVESFPFSIVDNPMYVGSTLCFLATSLWYESPVGLALTLLVHFVYRTALKYEEPFTKKIYADRDLQRRIQDTNGPVYVDPRKER